MKEALIKFVIWSSIIYQTVEFIIIDEELETLFDENSYNNSKAENSSKPVANHSEYDISQLFHLYDKVFNITEQSEIDFTLPDDVNMSMGLTDVSFSASVTNVTADYPKAMIIIEDSETESASKTDGLLMESVEKIGDAEIQNEFTKEVETVQYPSSYDTIVERSENNESFPYINDVSEFVTNETDNNIINYDATYEEKIFVNTTTEKKNVFNETTEDPTIYNKTKNTDKDFEVEVNTSSIHFGESFFDSMNETDTDDKYDFNDEIMVAIETNVEQLWNLTDKDLTTSSLDEQLFVSTEKYSSTNNEMAEKNTVEAELSTTKLPDVQTESVTESNAGNSKYLLDSKERNQNFSNVESNFSIIDEHVTVSPKTARGLTDNVVKNALSQEKPNISDFIVEQKNTINITSVCMMLVSIVTLCLLLGVSLILIIQKFNLLRHNDTVAPA